MELQLGARASSTVCKYRAAWFKWRTWALSKIDVPVIPAQPAHVVALFITQLANTAKVKGLGFSTLEGAAYGIAWAHKMGGLTESPTDYPLVKMTVQNAAYPNLSNRKSHCLVGYAGFLRADEILKIKVCDFKILVDHMLVSVPERKNYQYRQGHIVPVIRSNKATCPILYVSQRRFWPYYLLVRTRIFLWFDEFLNQNRRSTFIRVKVCHILRYVTNLRSFLVNLFQTLMTLVSIA